MAQYIYLSNGQTKVIPGTKGGLRSRIAVVNHFIVYQKETALNVWADCGGHGDPDNAIVTGGQCRMGVRGGNWCIDIELTATGFTGTESPDGITGDWKCVHEIPKWNPQVFNDLNLWVKADSRSGLTLTDSINPANSPTILPSYFYKPETTTYFYIQDNGALDIGATDFTFTVNVKAETDNRSAYRYLAGKLVQGAVNGKYGFYADITTGYLHAYVVSSGGAVDIASTTALSDTTMQHLRLDINQTTKVVRFFINNSQVGVNTSYTGTFSALNNTYGFSIGTGQTTGGAYTYLPSCSGHSDIFIFNRVLSDADALLAYNRGVPINSKAHYPLLGVSGYKEANTTFNIYGEYDASGNNYHLTGVGVIPQSYRYISSGSRHGLDIGYTLYSNGYNEVYVPYTDEGDEILNPPVLVGFTRVANFPADSLNHNLCNSKLRFVTDFWDRSNATIWSDSARLYSATGESTYYDATSATTQKEWHITELVNLLFDLWANTGHKAKGFVKISDHSYGIRRKLNDIVCFDNDKTGNDKINILSYCLDYKSDNIYENEYIYWKYDSQNICAISGQKVLKYESGSVYLSIDNGLTYPYSKAIAGLTDVQFAYIFSTNGNIWFASGTKLYVSTDNLTNITEVVPTGADGNPFVAGTNENFKTLDFPHNNIIGGVEYLVWGTYATTSGVKSTNMNMWFVKGNEVTAKSIFKAHYTAPDLEFIHFHGVSFNPNNNKWYFYTGDGGTNDVYIVECTYDFVNTWSFVELVESNDLSYYKSVGWQFVGDDAIWGVDLGISGIWKSPTTDIGTPASYTKLFSPASSNYVLYGGNLSGSKGLFSASAGKFGNIMITTNDSYTTLRGNKIYGLPSNVGLIVTKPPKTDGWGFVQIWEPSETATEFTKNGVMWYKIK